jgi:hypothetical protein
MYFEENFAGVRISSGTHCERVCLIPALRYFRVLIVALTFCATAAGSGA